MLRRLCSLILSVIINKHNNGYFDKMQLTVVYQYFLSDVWLHSTQRNTFVLQRLHLIEIRKFKVPTTHYSLSIPKNVVHPIFFLVYYLDKLSETQQQLL